MKGHKSSAERSDKAQFLEFVKETADANRAGIDPHLISQVVDSIRIARGFSEQEKLNCVSGAITLLKDINPANKIEGMLATQMVATHGAAMECLRRAMLRSQSFEGRDQNLKPAEKLLAIFAGQMDALKKSRGKGQQKVNVEHVHVEAGGQAVVGNVQIRAASTPPIVKSTTALAHTPAQTIDLKVTRRARVGQAQHMIRHSRKFLETL